MDKFRRLLNLVALLESSPWGLPATEIKEQLGAYGGTEEASRRTFERDKSDLLAMGVPLETLTDESRDPPVAVYRIRYPRTVVRDPGFTPAELAALKAAATTMALRDMDIDEVTDATDGLRKLGGLEGPSGDATVAEIPIDGNITAVFEAILAERGTVFTYGGRTRRVVPRQIAQRGGHWYLRAFDLDRGDLRNYRVDRIEGRVLAPDDLREADDVDDLPEPPPLGTLRFRPWEYGDDPATVARVRLDATVAPLALSEDPDLSVVERDPDGAVVVELAVRNPAGLWTWLVSFLDRAELLHPTELRAAFVEGLEAMAAGAGAGGGS